jgi:hypothetical protein
MKIAEVQSALDTQLRTVSGLPTLQVENTRFNASSNVAAFVRATLILSESAYISCGPNGIKQTPGTYAIDVFYPLDTGATAARTLADVIAASFIHGAVLTSGTTSVNINTSSIMTGFTVNKYYCVPVRVTWNVFG